MACSSSLRLPEAAARPEAIAAWIAFEFGTESPCSAVTSSGSGSPQTREENEIPMSYFELGDWLTLSAPTKNFRQEGAGSKYVTSFALLLS